MRIPVFLPIILFSFGIFSHASAQSGSPAVSSHSEMPGMKDFRTWDLGFHFGVTQAHTDISSNDLFSGSLQNQLAYGLSLTKFLSHSFALQGDFITGKISSKDKEKPLQYFYTTSIKYDASINAVFQIGNISFLKRNSGLAIYGYLGIGMISFDPSSSWFVQDNLILTDTTTPSVNYHNTKETVFPLGLGVKYRVDNNFSIVADYSLRITNTDKLDGYFRLFSGNDNYSYIRIGLTCHLGKKEKILEWNNPVEDMYKELTAAKDKVDLMSKDTDKDGVADFFDKEYNTPAGAKVYGDGTSVDSDGDGVPDYKDAEPFSFPGAKVDANGKELDSDGDGIPDRCDLEPNTAKGALVNKDGITISNQPAAKEPVSNSSASAVVSGYLPSVFFELNESVVQKKYSETLASVALIMRNNPELKFEIVGNCDVRASKEYNVNLGMKRAEAVKAYLVKKFGIDASRLTATTREKKEPITNEDHAMNRRVDFKVR
jgi:OOP family OmpA-OmpF porin